MPARKVERRSPKYGSPHGTKARHQGRRKIELRPFKRSDIGRIVPKETIKQLVHTVNMAINATARREKIGKKTARLRLARQYRIWNEPFEHKGIEGQLVYDITEKKIYWSSTRRKTRE